jgi:nucleoside-diphosphate-sugar epimerase
MNIVVTGHLGYIGSLLVPMLIEHGHRVCGIDSDLYRQSLFGEAPPAVPMLRKDVRDIEKQDLQGYDAVIHLAGLSNDPLGDLDPQLTNEINYLATARLAELCSESKIERFLFASSCSLYGSAGSDMIDEESPAEPITPYALSKYSAEQDLQMMASESFSPILFRCATAHGYSPKIRFDLVINNLVAWAVTTGDILIKSDGSPWRPFVHVVDICEALTASLKAPRGYIHNQIFNIGATSENYQVKDVAAMVERIIPACRVTYAKGGGPDKRCYRVNCDKFARYVRGFVVTWPVERSIEDLYGHYQRLKLQKEDFEGVRFNRISHVKYLLEQGIVGADLRRVKA